MVDFSLSHTVTDPPTWLDVAGLVIEAYYLPEQIVCNAWIRRGMLGLLMERRMKMEMVMMFFL